MLPFPVIGMGSELSFLIFLTSLIFPDFLRKKERFGNEEKKGRGEISKRGLSNLIPLGIQKGRDK